MAIAHLPRTASADAVAEAVAADGAVIVDRLASPDLMDRIGQELRPWLARTPVGPDDFSGRSTRRTGRPMPEAADYALIAGHPLNGIPQEVLDTARAAIVAAAKEGVVTPWLAHPIADSMLIDLMPYLTWPSRDL